MGERSRLDYPVLLCICVPSYRPFVHLRFLLPLNTEMSDFYCQYTNFST